MVKIKAKEGTVTLSCKGTRLTQLAEFATAARAFFSYHDIKEYLVFLHMITDSDFINSIGAREGAQDENDD